MRHLAQRGLHLPSDERDGGDDERHHRRRRADRRADDEACQRDDRYHQDNEGDGADRVDDGADRAVHRRCIEDLAPRRHVQEHAERDAERTRDDHTDRDHVDRLSECLSQQGNHFGGHSRSPPVSNAVPRDSQWRAVSPPVRRASR